MYVSALHACAWAVWTELAQNGIAVFTCACAVWTELAQNGIAVFTFDAHAHGRSHPKDPEERAVVWRFEDLVSWIFGLSK
jgi:alpha-beta hydrolase superfamily lysophospholipase